MALIFARALQALVLTFLAGGMLVGACAQAPSAQSASQRQKLKLAEGAADRVLQRFHETLDFGTVVKEDFVREPKLRRRALNILEEHTPTAQQHGEALIERAYVSIMNYVHLLVEYRLVQDAHQTPPEIARAGGETKLFRWPEDADERRLTPAELEQALTDAEHVSDLYRKSFPPRAFQSLTYRRHVAEMLRREAVHLPLAPRIEYGNTGLEIGKDVPVYIVRRELFDYYFIEENGTMRLVLVNFLISFRF